MSTPQPIQSDGGGQYLAYRAQVPESSAGDSLLKEVGGEEVPRGTPQAPSGAPQTPGPSQHGMAYRVGADLLKGATETPRAIYTGARDAVINTYDMIDDFSKWAADNIEKKTGIPAGGKLADVVRPVVDKKVVADPTSTTGGLVKGVSQFLTGLALTRRTMGNVGFPTGSTNTAADYGLKAIQGAAANFAAFDPHQQRLSNLVEKFPALSNPVTQYLSAQPGDSEVEGRVKNSLEGLGLGTLTDGLMKGLRVMRGMADAKAAPPEMAPATEPGISPNAFRELGDSSPEAPLVSDQPFSGPATPQAPVGGKTPLGNYLRGQDAQMKTAGVTPKDVVDAANAGQSEKWSFQGKPLWEMSPRELQEAAEAPDQALDENSTLATPHEIQTVSTGISAVANAQSPEELARILKTSLTAVGTATDPHSMDLRQLQAFMELRAGLQRTQEMSWDPTEISARALTLAGRETSGPEQAKELFSRFMLGRENGLTSNKINPRLGKPVPPVESSVEGALREPPRAYINFAKIDTPEDVQNVMQTLADRFKDNVDSARRGTQTFEQINLNSQMENAWDLLQNRRTGEPLNAEQSVAARELWASSADKLKQLAQTAVAAPTEENLFSFRKMMATHYAIQSEVMGARTETARALASWRIPVGSSASRLQDITDRMMNMSGGMDNVRDMAQKVSAIADSHPYETEQFIQKSAWERTRDGLVQAFRDGLLSSPVTQTRILASNVTTGIWRIGERAWASKISQAIGTPNGVSPGEANAMWSGWIGGFKNSMAFAGKAFKTGVTGEGIGEPHEPYPSNISAEAFNLKPDGMLGRSADFIGNALSLGRRGIATQHDMALTAAYSAEKNAQAVRMATQEVNSGELESGKFNSRVADLLANPPSALDQASKAAAKYQSFLDEPGNDTIGKLTNWMLEGRKSIPALNILAPFIKIPSRIMSYTFERSPLAPMMSEWRSKVAAGGATRDLALAQASMGTGIFLSAADMTMNGMLKGGGPPQKGLEQAQEREGSMRDSMKVGNRFYNINGVHPIGKLMLLAADVAEAITGGQQELHQDADTEKLAVGTALAIGRTLVDNSYFQGFANLFATLHDARVGGAGEGALLSTAGSAVPAISGAAARATDPYQREIYSLLDEFKSKIPGLSKTLPPRRNLWGEPVPSGHDPLTNFISPVKIADEKHEPIDDEILKQGFNISMPDRQQTFKNGNTSVPIDMSKHPEAYSRLLQLSGNELKHPAWNLGLKDLLNGIVSGDHPLSSVYNLKSDGPEGGKEVMIRDLISQYRDLAKKQVLEEFPAIEQEVGDKAEAKRALKFGGLQ